MAALDTDLFLWINHVWATGWLDEVMLAVSSRYVWATIGVGTILWALVRRNGRLLTIALSVGVAIGVADLVTYQVLKPTFQRLRPCHDLTDVRVVPERCGGDYGFPSNHAANSAATVAVMAMLLRSRRIVGAFAVVAVLVGLSRSYLGVHYPGDVLAGFLVGSGIGALIGFQARRRLARWLGPEPIARP